MRYSVFEYFINLQKIFQNIIFTTYFVQLMILKNEYYKYTGMRQNAIIFLTFI